jgi:hypothetical protein
MKGRGETAAQTLKQGGDAVAARNEPTEPPTPDAARAKSGRPVPDDVVLQDYVMLDFVDDFVEPRELRIPTSDPD